MLTKQCAILVGGMGSRLGALTSCTPKPLLEVAGEPFLDVLVSEAVRRGFTDIVLLAGYKERAVASYAGALQTRLGTACRVRISVEPEPLGTGGAVWHARDLLEDKFLLLNGDTWFDFNWLDLFQVAGNACALAAHEVPNADRYETLKIAADGIITQIVPRFEGSGSALVNGGVYVLRKGEFGGFPERFSIESDVLPDLVRKSRLRGRQYNGFFLDIGIPETFAAAQTLVPDRRRRPAVFFDRDGVLNRDDNYVGSIERFHWIEGARDAIRLVNKFGYYVFVVTNQAGVARGLYDEAAVQLLHDWMAGELRGDGAYVDDWRYCPYHPDGSIPGYRACHDWRKPEPGMILDLLDTWPIDIRRSMLVGDKESDCEAARRAGIKPVIFDGGNLYDFMARILNEQHPSKGARE